MIRSSSFLSTLNTLTEQSGGGGPDEPAPDRVRQIVLNRLKQGPATERELGELSLPNSALAVAIEDLKKLKLIESTTLKQQNGYALTDYAAKALTYITPG
jgi:hypothetical protein